VVKVTRISPTLDELTRSLLFEAEIDNSDGRLRTGLFAEAAVVLDPDARALVVPRSAVTEFAGAEKVWAVEEGRSAERIVITGQRRGDLVEIVSGLDAGTVVLWNGDDGRIARIDSVPRDLPASSAQVAAQPAEPADLGAGDDAAGAEEPAENVGGP
jgi:multidrug efflux pump subunit AcrA (membrane-fusion protein)